MRKIISILVALGLVLGGLTLAATPAMADVEGPIGPKPVVTIPPTNNDCAACPGVYNITFNITALVEEGVHEICIDFPEDTVVPPTGADWVDGDIVVYSLGGAWPEPVFGSEVTVTDSAYGTQVCCIIPFWDLVPGLDNPITVEFNAGAGIVNPTTPGQYTLFVWTTRVQDSTPVESEEYTIKPYYSSYKWVWDSSPTYPGLAEDFVPPFKMCGQNTTGTNMTGHVWNTTISGFLNAFNITFMVDVEGCNVPCNNVTLSFHLKDAPAGSTTTLNISGVIWSLVEPDDVCTPIVFTTIPLAVNTTVTFNCSVHFNAKGDYELCFIAACISPPCPPPCCEPIPLPETCYDITVYQWKDAYKIPIHRKWNLISLPLVPLVDPPIEDCLKALPDWDTEIVSVWYLDRSDCNNAVWKCYSPTDACTGLTTMEDGKAYWVRTVYDPADPLKQVGTLIGHLWVWGTPKPTPPASPSSYPVCDGWNMVGYTEIGPMWDDIYLWNFFDLWGAPLYGAVYGWNALTQTWDIPVMPFWVRMLSGKGYWVSFGVPGAIYPP